MAASVITQLMVGVEPGARDADIVQAYIRCQRDHADGGVQWRFGVRNARGMLYRQGVFTSFESAMAFADRMEDFGYVLEPESRADLQAGLHVVYAPAVSQRGASTLAGPGAEPVQNVRLQFA